jgi:hypothetical protein
MISAKDSKGKAPESSRPVNEKRRVRVTSLSTFVRSFWMAEMSFFDIEDAILTKSKSGDD